jgi:hypothetical protein
MIVFKFRVPTIYKFILLSSLIFSMITAGYANESMASQKLENTLTLNQGSNEHITASSTKTSNGDSNFQAKLSAPGVSITEQVDQQAQGGVIKKNKIVVTIGKNESVEFVQEFDGNGRKASRSVIKRPITVSELQSTRRAGKHHKNLVASKGGADNLAIEHQTDINVDGKYTTTTVRSNNFSFTSGIKNWMLIASAGYARFSNAVSSDGSTGVGRLALNRSFSCMKGFDFGMEAAIQNGLNMRPIVQQRVLDALGGTPILATIKPVIELLPTLSKRFSENGRITGFAKLGIAYRSMTFDRDTIPNINKVSPDLHLGLSSNISDTIIMMIYYQAIFGKSPNINATLIPLPANNLGRAANIPTQQAILLGIAFNF